MFLQLIRQEMFPIISGEGGSKLAAINLHENPFPQIISALRRTFTRILPLPQSAPCIPINLHYVLRVLILNVELFYGHFANYAQ